MALVILTQSEKKQLLETFMRLTELGAQYPLAREEAMTALRCLKAIHSNVIEDKRVDRIFLQVLLHGAGIADKSQVSDEYEKASIELKGQEAMLRWLESEALRREKVNEATSEEEFMAAADEANLVAEREEFLTNDPVERAQELAYQAC